ncbi:hypothetical protein BDY21DRAFT_286731, partial [Lineolata rhizophorae]
FKVTADVKLQSEPALRIASHIWCRPYLQLSPSSCFVLDDGSGDVVGYILSTPDTEHFVNAYLKDYVPNLDEEKLPMPKDLDKPVDFDRDLEDSLLRILYSPEKDTPELIKTYPAHFHIDILPPFQRKGFGSILMQTLLRHLKDSGVRGVHLNMVASNEGAKVFYSKKGFKLCLRASCNEVSVRDNQTLCLVRQL